MTNPVDISLELWKAGNMTLKDTLNEIEKSYGIIRIY